MSERMNKERAREELRDRKILAEIEYNQSEDAKKKDNLLRHIQALDIAIESLDNEWIDVRDRLPSEAHKDYMVTLYYKNFDMCEVDIRETSLNLVTGEIEFMHNSKQAEIIAWRPLPKPYERKE